MSVTLCCTRDVYSGVNRSNRSRSEQPESIGVLRNQLEFSGINLRNRSRSEYSGEDGAPESDPEFYWRRSRFSKRGVQVPHAARQAQQQRRAAAPEDDDPIVDVEEIDTNSNNFGDPGGYGGGGGGSHDADSSMPRTYRPQELKKWRPAPTVAENYGRPGEMADQSACGFGKGSLLKPPLSSSVLMMSVRSISPASCGGAVQPIMSS
uniref:Uncharacterized protein n=1 Tax=Anopheles culicifacies TaxID=139723 RepID=A0A182M2Y0_9DIPT